MNIPEEKRENDQKTLTKEEIHELNRREEEKARAHQNQHPDHNGEGRNPIHNDKARR